MPERPSRHGLDARLVHLYFELLDPVARVLDIGCGVGDVGRYKPRPDIRVVGLDKDPSVARLASRSETVIIWDGESRSLPFRDRRFDGIIAKDVLEHLQEPWHLVAEMHRVLKPGGAAVVSVPMAKARAVWDDYTHIRGFTPRSLRAMFADYGFEAGKIFRMGGVPLAGRLGLVRHIPMLLSVPPFNWIFGSSYMMVVRKT